MIALRKARWFVFGALLLLLVLIATSLTSLRNRVESLDIETGSGPVWFVSRIEFDALQLDKALNRYIAGNEEADTVNLRYDLLWSRLVSLGEGNIPATLKDFDVDTSVANELLSLLKAYEPTILKIPAQPIEGGDEEVFLNELTSYNEPLRELSLAVLEASSNQAKGWRDDILAISNQNGLLLSLVNVAFLVALAFLVVENLRATDSIKEKERLLEDATAANIAKSQFISVMNHELRTPLSSIRGAVTLLNAGVAGEQTEKAKRLIHIAQSNSEHLTVLIQDLLDFEKFSVETFSFDPEPINLGEFIEGELSAFVALGETYGVDYVMGHIEKDAICNVDPVRLRQILTNIVSNAAKFSAVGMQVTIALKQPSDTIILSVTDTGIGIPNEAKSKVFDAFYQVDSSNERNVGGTGLGLRIAKLIVERMGGEIWFDSQLGMGTTFYVSFPCGAHMLHSKSC